jgi:hypothetical protein
VCRKKLVELTLAFISFLVQLKSAGVQPPLCTGGPGSHLPFWLVSPEGSVVPPGTLLYCALPFPSASSVTSLGFPKARNLTRQCTLANIHARHSDL